MPEVLFNVHSLRALPFRAKNLCAAIKAAFQFFNEYRVPSYLVALDWQRDAVNGGYRIAMSDDSWASIEKLRPISMSRIFHVFEGAILDRIEPWIYCPFYSIAAFLFKNHNEEWHAEVITKVIDEGGIHLTKLARVMNIDVLGKDNAEYALECEDDGNVEVVRGRAFKKSELMRLNKLMKAERFRKSFAEFMRYPTLHGFHLLTDTVYEHMKMTLEILLKNNFYPTRINKKLLVYDERPFVTYPQFSEFSDHLDMFGTLNGHPQYPLVDNEEIVVLLRSS